MTNAELDAIAKKDNYSWVKIKRFDPKDFIEEKGDESVQYSMLRKHHDQESNFLITKCQELAKEVIYLREQHYGSMENAG